MLRMPTIGGQFARLADTATREGQTHTGYLEALLPAEMEGARSPPDRRCQCDRADKGRAQQQADPLNEELAGVKDGALFRAVRYSGSWAARSVRST